MPLFCPIRRASPIANGTLAVVEPVDSGCNDGANTVVDDGEGTIALAPWKTRESKWLWYLVRVDHVYGRTLTVTIPAADRYNGYPSSTRLGCWSYDIESDDWYNWESVTQPAEAVLANTTPFARNTIYVAQWPAYTSRRLARDVTRWLGSPHCRPGPSADASGAYGTATPQTNGVVGGNRSIPALPYVGLHFTDFARSGTSKNTVVLTGGVHPGETPGSFALGMLLDLLASPGEDEDALDVLASCNVFAYPNVNPQGRYGGLYRTVPGSASDSNRTWHQANPSECQTAAKVAILDDCDGLAHAFIDFHSFNHSYNGSRLNLGIGDPTFRENSGAFLSAMASLDPNWQQVDSGLTEGPLENWARANLDDSGSLTVSFTAESGSSNTLGIPEYRLHGERLLRALAECIRAGGVFPHGIEGG